MLLCQSSSRIAVRWAKWEMSGISDANARTNPTSNWWDDFRF
jgi:hypothetical protein